MHDSGMEEGERLQTQLLSEYSTLDAATVLAILSDFDIHNPRDVQTARQTLDVLKESAELEENSAFDTNASRPSEFRKEGSGNDDGDSTRSVPEWESHTDDTSLSQEMSSLELEGSVEEDKAYVQDDLVGMGEEGKVQLLVGLFPTLKEFDVKWTLKKCKDDINKAVDELMSQAFLEESGGRTKGVEAFSETDFAPRSRKGKNRKKKKGVVSDELSPPDSPVFPEARKWDSGKEDVDFISSRTGIPVKQVNSMYHNNGGSIRNTISAILDAHLALGLESNDALIQSSIIDLSHEFPSIAPSKIEAIVQLTHPSTAHAHELAKALTLPLTTSKPSNLQISFRHAPLDLDPSPTSPRPGTPSSSSNLPLHSATALAAKYSAQASAASAQASAAYRKSKSTPLMAGAAGHYAQTARDAAALARSAHSAAADALVAAQSSSNMCDLHGVSVADAKRITSERVAMWWQGAASGGGKKAGGGTYTVVTGRGNHSERGVGKLGPAVAKMLLREGWKVQVASGYVVVLGAGEGRR